MDNKEITGLGAISPIILELYKDMAQPAAKNVGLALSAVTSFGIFMHLVTSWGTERLNLCLKNNLEKYAERIKDIPQDSIVEAAPEVAIPILEKLSYVTNEELRNLYVELLAKASIKEDLGKAHPSFTNIINSISPDEAVLLSYFKENPLIKSRYFFHVGVKKSDGFKEYLQSKENFIELQFPENLSGYLENFEGLGIIYITDSNTSQVRAFEKMERSLTSALSVLGGQFRRISLMDSFRVNEQKQSLYVTNYGKLFLDAVMVDDG